MAALEHSSWQIVDLAGSPVRRNATGWIGSGARTHRSRKLPVAGKYPQGQLTARLLTDSKQSASGGKGRGAVVG